MVVHLEPEGRDLIERVFPEFNKYEAKFTADLDDEERAELARLLRRVTATADGVPLVADRGACGLEFLFATERFEEDRPWVRSSAQG